MISILTAADYRVMKQPIDPGPLEAVLRNAKQISNEIEFAVSIAAS
jgi:hypothetical protein